MIKLTLLISPGPGIPPEYHSAEVILTWRDNRGRWREETALLKAATPELAYAVAIRWVGQQLAQ